MELELIIKKIISENGKDVVTSKYFVNYISDYNNKVFNPPAVKNILNTIIDNGYAKELLSSNRISADLTINTIADKIANQYGYSIDNTKYLLKCIAYGLDLISNVDSLDKQTESIDKPKLNNLEEKDNRINFSEVISKSKKSEVSSKFHNQRPQKKIKEGNQNASKSNKSCCSILFFGFLLLLAIGWLTGSNDKDGEIINSEKFDDTINKIFLSRTYKDTIKASDGTPIEIADVTKNDIQLILDKDSLTLLTPYECSYPSIGFKPGENKNYYNKLTKEFQEELVYEFQFVGKTNDLFIYKLDKKLFPDFEKDKNKSTVEGGGRLCDVFLFYVPKSVAKQKHQSFMKKMKFNNYIDLDVFIEGRGCNYKKTFYSSDYYKEDNKKLKQYFFN